MDRSMTGTASPQGETAFLREALKVLDQMRVQTCPKEEIALLRTIINVVDGHCSISTLGVKKMYEHFGQYMSSSTEPYASGTFNGLEQVRAISLETDIEGASPIIGYDIEMSGEPYRRMLRRFLAVDRCLIGMVSDHPRFGGVVQRAVHFEFKVMDDAFMEEVLARADMNRIVGNFIIADTVRALIKRVERARITALNREAVFRETGYFLGLVSRQLEEMRAARSVP